MATIYKVDCPNRKPLFEGVQGENEARSIQFDITPWVDELGDGAVTATAKRPQDSQPYPVTVTKDGTTVTWKPTSTDTAYEGVGSFQLEYTVGGVIAKTCIWSTQIAPSLDPAGDPPDPYYNYLAEMRQVAAEALQHAQDAEQSADDAQAEVYEAEAWAKGTKNGTPVSSSDAQYQNNAKYWAEQSAANQYGAYIVKSASGDIASFSDGADDIPMKSLKVVIVPKQAGSGDPSPDNVRPITGWTDVNVNVESANIIKTPYIGGASAYGVNFTKNDDGSVHVAGTPTRVLSWIFDNSIKLKGGARYTFGYFGDMPNMNEWRLQVYSTQTSTLYGFIRKSSPTLVIEPTQDDTVTVYFDMSSGAVGRAVDFTVQPVLAHGEMPAAYSPYTGTTTPVPLGQTVYGGEVDVTTGVLTITKRALTGYDIVVTAVGTNSSGNKWADITVSGLDAGSVVLCDKYKQVYGSAPESNVFVAYTNAITVVDNRFTDIATAQNLLRTENTILVYNRRTPQTVQLTPTQVATLLGTNNVWSDAGSVEVEYRADPTLAYNELANVIVSLGGNL